MTNWDWRLLGVARYISSFSKDPSTKVGAVIAEPSHRIVSLGYNGFPRGIADTPERLEDRDLKYKMTLHAEKNAILFAQRNLAGMTLYTWPFMACSACAAMVIQAGIARHVYPPIPADKERWREDMALSAEMLHEAGVELVEMNLEATREPEARRDQATVEDQPVQH